MKGVVHITFKKFEEWYLERRKVNDWSFNLALLATLFITTQSVDSVERVTRKVKNIGKNVKAKRKNWLKNGKQLIHFERKKKWKISGFQ